MTVISLIRTKLHQAAGFSRLIALGIGSFTEAGSGTTQSFWPEIRSTSNKPPLHPSKPELTRLLSHMESDIRQGMGLDVIFPDFRT